MIMAEFAVQARLVKERELEKHPGVIEGKIGCHVYMNMQISAVQYSTA